MAQRREGITMADITNVKDCKKVLEDFRKELEEEIKFEKNGRHVLYCLREVVKERYTNDDLNEIHGYYKGLRTALYLLDHKLTVQEKIEHVQEKIETIKKLNDIVAGIQEETETPVDYDDSDNSDDTDDDDDDGCIGLTD